jgi:hypothetical protein
LRSGVLGVVVVVVVVEVVVVLLLLLLLGLFLFVQGLVEGEGFVEGSLCGSFVALEGGQGVVVLGVFGEAGEHLGGGGEGL